MPLFEYVCADCSRKFTLLVGVVAETDADSVCPACQSANIQKRVSRISRVRSEERRIDDISDRLDRMDEPESSAEMRSLAKEVGKAMDDDLSDDFEQAFEADSEGSSADD